VTVFHLVKQLASFIKLLRSYFFIQTRFR